MDPRHFRGAQQQFQKKTSQAQAENVQNPRHFTVRTDIQDQPVEARGLQITYTNDPVEVEAWLRNNVVDVDCRALGFDIEWKPQFVKKKHGGKENKTAVLQLSTEVSAIVVHITHLKTLPRYLRDILANQSVSKVGCGIRQDVLKLLRDRGLRCKGAIELPQVARESGYGKEYGSGLRKLARSVLGMEMNKPKKVQLSNWENQPLTSDQIHYAALDAWVGIKLYSHMQAKMNSGQNTTSGIDDLIDVQPVGTSIVRCTACGKKCKGQRNLQEHMARHIQCDKCGMMFVSIVPWKHRYVCVGSQGHSSHSA